MEGSDSSPWSTPPPLSHPSDLSLGWIRDALSWSLCRKVEVNSISVQKSASPEGFLSEILYFNADYSLSDEMPLNCNLVLKFLPNEPKRSFVLSHNVASREINANKLFSCERLQAFCGECSFELPVPKIYYAGLSDNAMTLVLQDVSVLGYKVLNSKDGLNIEQTTAALQAIATMHAVHKAYSITHGLDSISRYVKRREGDSFLDTFIASGLNQLIAMYETGPVRDILLNLAVHPEQLRSLPADLDSRLDTVCHGDFWAGQVMFNETFSKVQILDWQFAHWGNPAVDIATMLLMSSHPSVYEDDLQTALQSYWLTFSQVLEAASMMIDITLKDFEECLERCWQYGFMLLASSIETHLRHGKINCDRLKRVVAFLHRRGTFKKIFHQSAS